MTTTAIEVSRLGKRYDVHVFGRDETLRGFLSGRSRRMRLPLWALRDVSFVVAAGESVAITGPNGSGKSTLLRLVAGVERPTTGWVRCDGAPAALLGLGVGFSEQLTGEENLDIAGGLLGLPRRDVRRLRGDIVEFSGLGNALERPVREYSAGMVARLGFALALHAPSTVLLIDEVLAVGDAEFRERCIERIATFRRNGGTLLFASHEAELVDRLSDRELSVLHGLVQETTRGSQ